MHGGGGDFPSPQPPNSGEYLLSLIQRPHHHHHPQQPTAPPPPQQSPAIDPAVAFMGPSIPVAASPWQSNGLDHPQPHPHHHHHHQHLPPWSHTPPSPYPPQSFFGLPHNPFPQPRPTGNHYPAAAAQLHYNSGAALSDDLRRLGFPIEGNDKSTFVQQQELKLKFGSLPSVSYASSPEVPSNGDSLPNLKFDNGFDRNLHVDPKSGPNNHGVVGGYRVLGSAPETTRPPPPPGFGNKSRGTGYWGSGTTRKGSEVGEDRGLAVGSGEFGARNENLHSKKESGRMGSGGRSNTRGNVAREVGLPDQIDHPGPPSGSNLHSGLGSGIEESRSSLNRVGVVEDGVSDKHMGVGSRGGADVDLLGEQIVESLLLEDESDDKNNNSKQRRTPREKDARLLDSRGEQMLSQRGRMYKRQMMCRRDIDSFNGSFLAIYESLIPPEEEKLKQKQLLGVLENLVSKEWPTSKLYLYGSCANSFGVSKSDIDVCLAIKEAEDKSKIIMKLADILQSDNLQNVQALTRARVPIVKLMDPATGISCDICVNNILAVVNTKLLRDYGLIDARLRQLAFIIKHWAKSRGVNETYHGTLSSYAYVLMCIHFLQLRRPAILPCLQEMESTYSVTVDDTYCSYFDQVDRLCNFGRNNKETIARLVWGFFYYWAYCHDYANTVISVRTGSILSKREKDWTRRIGNDRHLICIEDPFETSHDLGRVVDKRSIKVLREEFERAADIMQNDPNPCIKLFEPYVRS